MDGAASSVNDVLLRRHIEVPEEWLVQCVRCLQSQENFNTRNLSNFVYDQFLSSDLRQIGCSCLPSTISNTTLHGAYCVQVNWTRNIGLASLGQYQKATKSENENVTVDTERDNQPPAWEPKPKRMLWMEVTDGSNTIKAMEYRLIPEINEDLLPGTKLLLHGVIQCRNNCLMLTDRNTKLLGGCVAELVMENSLPNLLGRLLGKETNTLNEIQNAQRPAV